MPSPKQYALLSLTLLILLSAVIFAAVYRPFSKSPNQKIDEYINILVDNNEFSGAVIVVSGNKVLVHNGYGMADHMHKIPFTTETCSFVGSCGKQLTAAAIMLLQLDGMLNVTDPVIKYIADFKVADIEFPSEKITLHHLLTHTSGLARGFGSNPPVEITAETAKIWHRDELGKLYCLIDSLDTAIALGCMLMPAGQPGEHFEYSNCGYDLLAKIVTIVSGLSLADFLKQRIFDPIGMTNTYFETISSNKHKRAKTSYRASTDDYDTICADGVFSGSGANLVSTVDDLARYLKAFFNGTSPLGSILATIISSSKKMAPDTEYPRYSSGWVIDQLDTGEPMLLHAGTIMGFSSFIHYYPTKDILFVVLSNTQNAEICLSDIDNILLDKSYDLPVHARPINLDVATKLIGVYEEEILPDSGKSSCSVTLDENALMFDMGEKGCCSLIPSSEDNLTWHSNSMKISVSFLKNDSDQINGFDWHQQEIYHYKKVLSTLGAEAK